MIDILNPNILSPEEIDKLAMHAVNTTQSRQGFARAVINAVLAKQRECVMGACLAASFESAASTVQQLEKKNAR